MGDCRIRISIWQSLVLPSSEENHENAFVTVSRTYSADTTVRECFESIKELWSLYKDSQRVEKHIFQLWDCTYNPPKEITDLPILQYPDVTGARSQTLQNAGWFPSGTLIAAPVGMQPSNFSRVIYDDEQYNRSQPLEIHKSGNMPAKVEFSNMDSRPAPSQVLGAVSDRFSDNWDVQTAQAQAVRLQNKRDTQQRQQERQDKLDRRIRLLEQTSSSKNAKVSAQVRSMLIRSRATGDDRLVPEDRVYFECYLDKGADAELEREFRYFSPQESMSGIVRALGMTPQAGSTMVELLVKRPSSSSEDTSTFVYQQLPSLMRVYEATSKGFLTGNLDTLIIRWFDDAADATESVLIPDSTVTPCDAPVHNSPEPLVSTAPMDTETAAATPVEEDILRNQAIATAIKSMDDASLKGKKPKKASAAATKVRQIQIKSKAKGDTKRIPKMEDRFFLEFVKIDSNDGSASSSCNFLGKGDSLNRIGQSLSLLPDDWVYLVPVVQGENTDRYTRIIDPSIKLTEAQRSGLLQPFDRVVLVSKGRLL
eukprot:Nitzschia sp. Nitz4//scaffold3_size479765//328967//330580//NITZ4_000136-RA/size479765-processed-gene-1.313-mRNA-1//-1//CDS//3329550866//1570//frame0